MKIIGLENNAHDRFHDVLAPILYVSVDLSEKVTQGTILANLVSQYPSSGGGGGGGVMKHINSAYTFPSSTGVKTTTKQGKGVISYTASIIWYD